jgi:hypothetical protein
VKAFIRGGSGREIELLTGRDARYPDGVAIDFGSELAALDFLGHFACEQRTMATLRCVLIEDRLCPNASSLGDHDVLRQLAWLLVCGRVKAVSAFARYGVARDGDAVEAAEQRASTEHREREYELRIQVFCEVTGHTLPVVPYAVYDGDGDEIARGITDREGYARIPPVRVQGTWRIVVFREFVEQVRLLLLGEDGKPIPETPVELIDSAGAKHALTSNRDGMVLGPRAASGRATLVVKADEPTRIVPVYLDPHAARARTVKVPGWFSPVASPPELALPALRA